MEDQLYNCDETGFYYKTLAGINEKSAPGCNKNKDRVTIQIEPLNI